MRKIQTIVACAAALALVGVSTLKAAENDGLQGRATAKSVHGNVQYQSGGSWMPVKVNEQFDPGVVLRTGPDSVCDLSVNGLSSAVRIDADTTMAIPEMTRSSSSRDADTGTMLDLQSGSALGNVKKISANSHYDIKTPHGVAGIRGTDWQVVVVLQPDGRYVVTFTSITGQVIVSAVVTPGGPPVVKVLRDGESWTPGEGDVHPTPTYLLNQFLTEIADLLQIVFPTLFPGGGPPIIYPFPTGGPSSQH
jgi:hypothetical protein